MKHYIVSEKELLERTPKTDQGGLKKSQKGCCAVFQLSYKDEFVCIDGYDEWVPNDKTLLETVLYNGELCNVDVFQTIRTRLYPEVA